jgi:hypothetical protein
VRAGPATRWYSATSGRGGGRSSATGSRVHPDWLGSPQHFAAAAALAVVVAELGRRSVALAAWKVAAVAVVVTMGAEALVEVVEYPLMYADRFHSTAYYDTIADIAASLAGSLVGAGAWLGSRARPSRERNERRGWDSNPRDP